jgi:hypothetical protein
LWVYGVEKAWVGKLEIVELLFQLHRLLVVCL